MPLGYKYAERSADSDVNWFEVGKELTDTLSEANRIREEKKEAYNQATREDMNNLANAPQGENQDVNGFTNNYVDLMTNQMLMDEKLFKSGRMSEKQYRLRRQNYTDGTSQLFNLSKVYQAEAAKTMADIDNGTLQSGLTISNMSSVEGIGNFSSSVATIDSLGDGRVGINLYENKIIDGKKVKVLSTNAVPVNVAMSKMMHKPLKFKVDEVTTSYVDGLGTRKDFLIEAATTAKAGSITELMGPDFLATKKDPVTQKIVKDTKDSISLQIDSYFQNPYNLTSILGDELGKYNPSSFIYDKAEAAKDPTKILLKIDPITNLPTIDEEGPNYKKQYEEASDFVAKKIYSKIDLERGIKPTAQSQLQERRPKTSEENAQTNMEKDAKNFAVNTSNFLYGTDAQKKEAITYFTGMGADIMVNPAGKPKGNYIMNNETGKYVLLETEDGDVTAGGRAVIGGLLRATGQNFPQDLVFKNMKIGKKFNTTFSGTGLAAERDVEGEYKTNIIDKVTPDLFTGNKVGPTVSKLKVMLKDVPGIQVVEKYPKLPGNNTITIKYTEGTTPKTIELNSNEDEDTAAGHATDLQKILEAVPAAGKLKAIGKETTTSGNAQSRIGSY